MRAALLFMGLGCNNEPQTKQQSATPPDGTTETGSPTTEPTGSTATTGDTGAPEVIGWPEWPLCSRTPQTQAVTLVADQADDEAGRYLDVSDVDGDGCAEVLVSAARLYGLWDSDIDTASYLLREPWLSGGLEEHAFAIFEGPPNGYDWWAYHNVLLPDVGQTAIGGFVTDSDLYAVHVHDLRSALQGSRLAFDEVTARIRVPNPYTNFGIPADLSDCTGDDGLARLCVGAIHSDTEGAGDISGQVLVYSAPLSGDLHILDDARSQIVGDDGDRAHILRSRADFDGDGRDDLLVGAFEARDGAGRVGLVTALPDGYHRLWDITEATINGTMGGGFFAGAEFGLAMSAGDIDSDGYVDLFAAAPLGNTSYVLRGPLAGDRSTQTAEYTFAGTEDAQWAGYALDIADFDGDGAGDLAIGAPYSIYFTDAPPGSVSLFFHPAQGDYLLTDADRTLLLGETLPDAFGMTLAAGDIDGDGLSDLAIGAPRDSTAGQDAGSVTLVFGASL